MRKNKLGFTLGEVLVSLAIIGIIMALAAHTIKLAKTSYTALTYFAHKNVELLVAEIMTGNNVVYAEDESELDKSIILCRTEKGAVAPIIAPDYKNNLIPNCYYAGDPAANGGAIGDTNLFCKYAVYLSNTSGKTDCEDSALFDVEFDNSRYEPKIKDLEKNWDKPNYIVTNGQRYYISKWSSNPNVSSTYGFRIVAIDLNGKSGPNISEYKDDEILPDIVQFLILDNGEIYPIGVAGSNVNIGTDENPKVATYLNTRVKGYNYNYNSGRTENVPADCYSKKGQKTPDLCNYAVLYLQVGTKSFLSYKEAFCGAHEGTGTFSYADYCYKNFNNNGAQIVRSELCPPSSHEKRVDQCDIKVVRPAFRYNLR